MGYRNESSFSRALVASLRRQKWFVQRIESGTTGKGIPDIYAISPKGQAMWLELKVIPGKETQRLYIPWRPGQQSWMLEANKYGQQCFTLVGFKDMNGVAVLKCLKPFPDNNVDQAKAGVIASTEFIFKDVGKHLMRRYERDSD